MNPSCAKTVTLEIQVELDSESKPKNILVKEIWVKTMWVPIILGSKSILFPKNLKPKKGLGHK